MEVASATSSANQLAKQRLLERLRKDVTDQLFRLITTVKRGPGSNYPAAWVRYDTLEAARAGAATLLREERVGNVMIVTDGLEHEFIEWCGR
jgi:hypothetical protein